MRLSEGPSEALEAARARGCTCDADASFHELHTTVDPEGRKHTSTSWFFLHQQSCMLVPEFARTES